MKRSAGQRRVVSRLAAQPCSTHRGPGGVAGKRSRPASESAAAGSVNRSTPPAASRHRHRTSSLASGGSAGSASPSTKLSMLRITPRQSGAIERDEGGVTSKSVARRRRVGGRRSMEDCVGADARPYCPERLATGRVRRLRVRTRIVRGGGPSPGTSTSLSLRPAP